MNGPGIPKPPVAKKIPTVIVAHGDRRVDEYFWMRERENPEVMRYIRAENRYTDAMMDHTKALQQKLFREMKSRVRENDTSVPEKIDDYYYYTRTKKGKQFPIYCRRRWNLNAEEEVILDVNELADKHKFFNMDVHKVSPDHNLLAYLADTDGSERHTLHVKDLRTGELLPERIPNTAKIAWSSDSRTLFYSVLDEEFRPHKVFRHVIGAYPKEDVEVFHEKDPMFYYLVLRRTKTGRYITITVHSATTSEVHFLRADRPTDRFEVIRPREHGLVYYAMDHEDKLIIVTNENAKNFKIVEAPIKEPSSENWRELLPHRDNVAICVSDPLEWVEVFKDHLAVFERENADFHIRIIDLRNRTSHRVALPESFCELAPVETPEFVSSKMRFKFSTMVMPPRIYEYDMDLRKLELLKQYEVPGYDPSRYESRRVFATAEDGTKVPISLVHRKGVARDGKNPMYLYGYGAYGDFESSAPAFDSDRVSLLDRGFVCAYAAVRGGGEMGKSWHEQGRMQNKINTFTDFIACAEHLIKEGYTSSGRLAINGRSAGGLLMGAVTNMRPDLFNVVVAEVPFVDAINSMLDEHMPLTAGEFEEWGNPKIKEHYDYFKLYSPYDNVEAKDYPNMLVTGSLNDSRVQYWEPLKWTAKLRALRTDKNLLLLRMNIVQGHSASPGRYSAMKESAFAYAFILNRLGIKD
ncbi:MAG: S9 family peptidase [Thermoplasmata archaeon]